MTEGIFPKVDGNILYASEVNRFSPKLIAFRNGVTNFASGTDYITIGSYDYIGTGSLGITEFMHIFAAASTDSVKTIGIQVLISGTEGLNNLSLSPQSELNKGYNAINHILTSGAMTSSGGNVGSNYSIFYNVNTNMTTASTNQTRGFIVTGY